MNHSDALSWLEHYGYLRPEIAAMFRSLPIIGNLFAPILAHFQTVLGLEVTGELDAATVDLMNAPRCGCRDVLTITDGEPMPVRWRKTNLTFAMHNYSDLLPQSVQDGIIDTAFGSEKSWGKDIEIDFSRIPAGRQADVNIYWKPLDGPGSVLAQCYLPDGRDTPIRMEIDSGENKWGLVQGSREANLLGTVVHELGHGVGSNHLQDRNAIMYPMANSNIIAPQSADIQAVLRLGYSPRATGTPTPPTPPASDQMDIAARYRGQLFRGKLIPSAT